MSSRNGGGPVSDRPGLSRDFIEGHRRARFVRAAAEVAHEFGLAEVTVDSICNLANGARATFYAVFPNVAACLSHGVDEASSRLYQPLLEPTAGEWLPALAATLRSFYRAVASDPLLAELLFIHSRAIDRLREGERLEDGVEALRPMLLTGRELAVELGRREPPALSEEFLARGYLAAVGSALLADRVEALPQESGHHAWLAGSIYLGGPMAARQLWGEGEGEA